MTRIHHVSLWAVIIIMVLAAGCTSSVNTGGAPPLVTTQETPAATPVLTAPVAAGTTQPGAAGTQASGTCTADISGDAANCGGCGYACPANALCQSGQCYCKDGFTVENNLCVIAPSGTNPDNGCPAGMSPCPDGYCYELSSSADNCGMCGNTCPSGMTCSASTCTNAATGATTAPTTTVTTATTTTATTSSVDTGPTLVKPGDYTLSCAVLGMTKCGGTCVNLSSSNGNCGSCGTICSGLTATCCGGTCTSLKTDSANCGSCGNVCKGILPSCESGTCKSKAVVRTTLPVKVIPSYKIVEPVIPIPIGPQI
jgi:Stigma-specific protein, Stig1